MDVVADQKQISSAEKSEINKQLKADLVDHLYEGCLPGTVSGVAASIAFYFMFRGSDSTPLLIGWVIAFNFMLSLLTGLYFFYLKNKTKHTSTTWEWAYSLVMTGCALMWVPCVFLMPNELSIQFLALIALFMVATAYATGTIGQFYLCIVTLLLIVAPVTVWCFYKGGLFYNLIGSYSLIYIGFMLGANLRSTRWFKDSIKLKLENTLVSYQANHDILTNLPNQRLLPQYLAQSIQIARKKNMNFAVVVFSLNRMEYITDTLGYEASNAIVKAMANRLTDIGKLAAKTEVGTQCIVTISRKDTFNILLIPLAEEGAYDTIKSLFSTLDEPFYIENKGIKMSASIGACFYPQDGEDPTTLLVNADAAMLQAKQFSGNHLEIYRKEINEQLPKRLEIENDLHEALAKNQLQVFYQPLVSLKTGQICGMEALCRWVHPKLGFVSPAQFIPIAEETGLIVPIGEWILKEACKQTMKWHQMGYSSLKVAVNIAQRQLRQENIIDTIKRTIAETEMDPAYLELELTEGSMLDESVIPIVQEFKRMGLSLAVDDFGTGYSGLSYLKRFAMDKLKIDQSFIRDIPGNNDSITIVSAILAMAKELNVKSLAEGVETKEQLEFLRSKGCDYIQGYYFSKPLDAKFFTQLLSSHHSIEEISKV